MLSSLLLLLVLSSEDEEELVGGSYKVVTDNADDNEIVLGNGNRDKGERVWGTAASVLVVEKGLCCSTQACVVVDNTARASTRSNGGRCENDDETRISLMLLAVN